MKIDDYNLTNDAKFLLSSMYKEYLERRQNNTDKSKARLFNNIENIQEIMTEWSHGDVLDTCSELRRKKLINAIQASDTLLNISLTTDAISLLEVSFKDKIDNVLEYATKIKSLIPFI